MKTVVRVVVHVLLFVLAIAVFYLGLGIGLSYNPTIGTAMWGAAAMITGINLVWIMRWKRATRRRQDTQGA